MKKAISLLIALVFTFLLYGCNKADISNYSINYGTSKLFFKEDMDSAISLITEKFSDWDGYVLYSIEYVDDNTSTEALDACNALGNGKVFTESIFFKSSFRTPIFNSGTLEPNELYEDFGWYLAREKDGPWVLLTWGYG